MKKVISILMCFIMIASVFSVQVSASEERESSVQPRFKYILATSITSRMSNGAFIFATSMDCNPNYVSGTKITAYVQRRPAGSSASWTVIGVSTATGTFSCELEGEKDGTSGYEYRLYAMYKATGKDGGTETVTAYSNIRVYE